MDPIVTKIFRALGFSSFALNLVKLVMPSSHLMFSVFCFSFFFFVCLLCLLSETSEVTLSRFFSLFTFCIFLSFLFRFPFCM